MFTEKALKQTTTLKTLERIKGTGGDKDYFVVYSGKVAYGVKVDFENNFMGIPTNIFCRVRLVKPEGVDIMSMSDWMYDGFNHKTVGKQIGAEGIEGRHLKIDNTRISFVLSADMSLEEYGDPSVDYDGVIVALRKDMKALGSRVYKSMRVLKEVPAETQKVIHAAMNDFVELYKPHAPEKARPKKAVASNGDKVVPIGSKTEKPEPKK